MSKFVADAGETNATKLFVRQSSGFRREFGLVDTLIFNIVGYALGMVLVMTPTFLGGLYPNASIYAVLTIGTFLSMFNGMTYGLFASAMPRSGGDYVFIGRTLSPALGFVCNWGFTWSQFLGLGVYTGWSISDALSPALSTFGNATGNATLVDWGSKIAQPVMIWGIGSLLLASVLIISIAGLRILKRFLNFLFLIALLGTVAMGYVFFTASHDTFVEHFNGFMATKANLPDAYNAIIEMSKTRGLVVDQPLSLWDSLLALPVGYWVFIGFTYSVYVGGEVKEPQKSQSLAIIGSLLFGYIVYMIILGQYYTVVGRDFNNAVAVMQKYDHSPIASGSMVFFAGLLTDNVAVNFLMCFSTFLWFYLLLFVMTALCVRNVFAWSFDQIIPQCVTRLTKHSGAPWIATVLIVGLAEVFLALHAFVGLAFINYIALFSVCFLVAGIAAIVFPYRRPRLFSDAPAIVRKTVAGIPLIVIAGAGNVILFLIVLYSCLTNPGVSGVQGVMPGIILVVIYLVGFVVYLSARMIRRRQGVNIDFLYDEIPPE